MTTTRERRERRIIDADVEVRSNDDGTVGVSGYAAVYDSPAHGEVIRSSAFTRSISQRDNIRFLVNHEGVPLASTRAGTMTVESRQRGLWFDIPALDVQNNPRAAEFVSAVRRGDLHQCSFAMTPTDDPMVDGVREIREAKLWELSAVTFPWYEDTEVGITGNRTVDAALVALRSAPLTADTRDAALATLRAAPPGGTSYSDMACALLDAICDRLEQLGAGDPWAWLDDFGPGWAVYCIYAAGESHLYQIAWEQAADGTITLGDAFEVERVTEYRPKPEDDPAPAGDPPPPAEDMSRTYSISEARALLAL